MPNPRNNITGEQWDRCDRCGFIYPMTDLTLQKGLKVCLKTCKDNLDIERRQSGIARRLEHNTTEGADLRWVSLAVFSLEEEEIDL